MSSLQCLHLLWSLFIKLHGICNKYINNKKWKVFTCRVENKDPMFYPDEYLVGIFHKKPGNVQGQSHHDYAIALNCNFSTFS